MAGIGVYLIVCPLVFLAGLVDAVAGGGGLISLPAYMIAGLPAHNAIGTNKVSACMGTSLATYKFWKKGFIPVRQAAFCAALALIGSTLGARLVLMVGDNIIKIIMLLILPLTAFYVFKNKDLAAGKGRTPYPEDKTLLISMFFAFAIGLYDGFYGPGTGTFLLLLLTGVARMELTRAAGITKAINLSTNVAAVVVFLLNGKVLFPLSIIAGVFGMAGNYIGAQMFTSKGTSFVRPLIIAVLIIFFIKVIYDLVA